MNKRCKSAGNQVNALTRLKSFLSLKERVVSVNSFIYSNFDYCPLVWMFSHESSLNNKIESLHKWALRFLLNDYENSYEELLEKSGKANMNFQRIRFLIIKIYKTISSSNPDFMKKIFEMKTNNRIAMEKCKLNLNISRKNQVTLGANSLKSYGPKIWNVLLNCWWSLYLTSFVFWRPKKKFKNFLESIALSRNTAHKVKLI